MNELMKIFPEYEDVFYDDIENHKKYFLPICSVNLQLLDGGKNEWLHIVSVKEIYDSRVGENTAAYHTQYTKCDMFGFDVIAGKYRFDADWKYFTVSADIENYTKEYSEKEIACNLNNAMYQLNKSYFKKHGKLYDKDFDRPGISRLFDIRALERLRKLTVEDLEKDEPSAYLSERLEKKLHGIFDEINTYNKPLEACKFDGGNLSNKPLDEKNKIFDYIACLEGYDFQMNAADQIYLFHNDKIKKAVICLEYT